MDAGEVEDVRRIALDPLGGLGQPIPPVAQKVDQTRPGDQGHEPVFPNESNSLAALGIEEGRPPHLAESTGDAGAGCGRRAGNGGRR